MKTDDNNKLTMKTGQASAAHVKALLAACKVRELPACKRAGMATSTILRWKQGSCPKTGQLDVLRRAIMEIASENGSLPDEYGDDLDLLRKTVELPSQQSQPRDLGERVDRLERVVEEQLGVTL